jgi:hypothetical protein
MHGGTTWTNAKKNIPKFGVRRIGVWDLGIRVKLRIKKKKICSKRFFIYILHNSLIIRKDATGWDDTSPR